MKNELRFRNSFGMTGFFAIFMCVALMFGIVSCKNNVDEPEKPVYYTVTFDSDGGSSVEAQNVESGKTAEKPTDPTKAGYDFGGWYNETTAFDFTKPVTEKINLKAKWTVHAYTVTYNIDGGTNASENPATYTIEDEITLKDAEKTGSTFSGWFNENTKVTKIAKGTTGDLTLTAMWDLATYDVTLNVNGGTITEGKNVTTYTYGTAVTLPTADDITRTGYKFEGWFTSNDNGTTLTGEAVTEITATDTGNKVFYAKWSLISYTITYNNIESGLINPNPTNYTVEDEITLVEIEKEGYDFAWYDAAEGGNEVTQIAQGSTGVKTLWARWTAIEYTITINGLGNGTVEPWVNDRYISSLSSTNNTFTYTVEDSILFFKSSFNKDGAELNGMYDAETNGNNLISSNNQYTYKIEHDTGDKIFWVRWNLNTYTITYEGLPNGVENPNTVTTFTVDDLPIRLVRPTSDDKVYWWELNYTYFDSTRYAGKDNIQICQNITATAHEIVISKISLQRGYDINSILRNDLNAQNATSFRKNDTEPESASFYLDETKLVPVWYDAESYTIYYYVQEGGKLCLNANSNEMFGYMRELEYIELSDFDTSNVTNMNRMFDCCTALTSLDLSNFDTSKVTNMSEMFSSCSSLTSLDLSSFDTSKVTNMSGMFAGSNALTSLDLSNFNTSNVKDMSRLVSGCKALSSLDLSNFDTSSVTDMTGMFNYCNALTSLDLSSFDTNSVTNMSKMFNECNALASLDLSNFDTGKVTNMSYMFNYCYALTSLDLSSFNINNVTTMLNMFFFCYNLTTIYVAPGTDWSASETLTDSGYMLYCASLTGGAGTKFDSTKHDKTYARVDGGTDSPGYFTVKE